MLFNRVGRGVPRGKNRHNRRHIRHDSNQHAAGGTAHAAIATKNASFRLPGHGEGTNASVNARRFGYGRMYVEIHGLFAGRSMNINYRSVSARKRRRPSFIRPLRTRCYASRASTVQ